MASLAPVDMVVLFDEDTPFELIQALRPDVLVKGADYSIDQVVGADLVQGWGGTVLLVELQAGHSTTGTIRRMTDPAPAFRRRLTDTPRTPGWHPPSPPAHRRGSSGCCARTPAGPRRGISRAISSENSGGQIQSCRPASTSVGAVIRAQLAPQVEPPQEAVRSERPVQWLRRMDRRAPDPPPRPPRSYDRAYIGPITA